MIRLHKKIGLSITDNPIVFSVLTLMLLSLTVLSLEAFSF